MKEAKITAISVNNERKIYCEYCKKEIKITSYINSLTGFRVTQLRIQNIIHNGQQVKVS